MPSLDNRFFWHVTDGFSLGMRQPGYDAWTLNFNPTSDEDAKDTLTAETVDTRESHIHYLSSAEACLLEIGVGLPLSRRHWTLSDRPDNYAFLRQLRAILPHGRELTTPELLAIPHQWYLLNCTPDESGNPSYRDSIKKIYPQYGLTVCDALSPGQIPAGERQTLDVAQISTAEAQDTVATFPPELINWRIRHQETANFLVPFFDRALTSDDTPWVLSPIATFQILLVRIAASFPSTKILTQADIQLQPIEWLRIQVR